MNVCVTGGAGFIGSHLVQALDRRGDAVTIIDRKPPFCSDVRTMARSVVAFGGFDVVVHLAAQTSVTASLGQPCMDAEDNVLATVALLEAMRKARNIPRLIYISSGGALYADRASDAPYRESSYVKPQSPYGLSKWVGERYCRMYADLYGISVTILRLSNVYGERMAPGSVVARFREALAAGAPFPVRGDGMQVRDFVHVRDVVYAIELAMTMPPSQPIETINIGGGQPCWIDGLAHACGASSIERLPAIAGEVRHSSLSIVHAKQVLGWIPQERSVSHFIKEAYRGAPQAG